MTVTIFDLIYALYIIFPAYCANAVPVILGGGTPMDFRKNFLDGKPILGSHKTFRGFFTGLAAGTMVGFIENIFFEQNLWLGFLLSLGALVGDLTVSFIKRRLDLPPGAPFPVADQLDFVMGALLFSLAAAPLPPLKIVTLIVIITPLIHVFTNFLAYRLGLKSTPW